MVGRLGAVCRRAREQAGVRAITIAQAAGVSEATISRFERGRGFPLRIDRVVEAYAHECGIDSPRDLWKAALKDWPNN